MSLFERLIQLDWRLFFLINGKWSNSFFDAVLPYTRESTIWLPLYLFLLIFVIQNFGIRSIYWIIGIIVTAALTDIISSHIVKESILRLRPCRDPNFEGYVRVLVKYCPSSSGFTSSHATNHFGVAMFIFITLRKYMSARWLSLFFAWAALICYAQVYVGVHFPADVFAGGLLGCTIGYIIASIYNSQFRLVAPRRISRKPGLKQSGQPEENPLNDPNL
jgi:membrane-associated phospholipid phosphatase